MKINPPTPSSHKKRHKLMLRATAIRTEVNLNILSLKYKGEWMEEPIINLLCFLISSIPFFEQSLTEARYRASKSHPNEFTTHYFR